MHTYCCRALYVVDVEIFVGMNFQHAHFIPIVGVGKRGAYNRSPPRNPLTRWDVSLTPANGIFLTKKQKNKNKNADRVEND